VNIADVWTDIAPVRHSKYKKREANALPLKLMDRIISMCTDPGSVVLDPFGGSGTTYVAAELTNRQWIGSELECSAILQRFDELVTDREHLGQIHANKNILFADADLRTRARSGKPLSPHYQVTASAKEAAGCICCIPEATRQQEIF
jgi:site-specific DNA-methyltransferase (adenine-specific)